ncbi:MAG: HTTM domain-containing protein [Candidatus Paceibacterota bacterium]|jgi:hypothetical protein
MQDFKEKIKEIFSLDYRSLALMRIGVGLKLIFDLIDRARDLSAHYSDLGTLPRSTLLQFFHNDYFISLHMASGWAMFEGILFIIAFIFAVMLVVGYRTTLATIISWFLLISLHNRNPLILQGGDVIFRVVLFWCMFLPWGKRFSFDRYNKKTEIPETKTFSGAAATAYIIQIVLVYIFCGLLKTGEVWQNGLAIYYALSIDQFTTPIGYFFLQFPRFLKLLTHGVLYTEFFGALAIISPIYNQALRMFAVAVLIIMQMGINLSMRIGLFGMIAVVTLIGLLPSLFWDDILPRIQKIISTKKKTGLKIYYDGVCGFCQKSTYYLKRALFLSPSTQVLPVQTDESVKRDMDIHNSWVIIDSGGNRHFAFDGFITMVSYSPIFFFFAPIFRINFIHQIGDVIYRRVSTKRTKLCLRPHKIEPETKIKKSARKIEKAVIVFLTIYIILWNLDTLPTKNKFIPESWKWIAWTTRLDQKFDMFAPSPSTEDGWYVMPGYLKNGSEINIYTGKPVTYEKPYLVAWTYKNQRWQKYLMNLYSENNKNYRLAYGQYLCREWNGSHKDSEQVNDFKIIYMLEPTLPDYQTPTITPTTIWEHRCF